MHPDSNPRVVSLVPSATETLLDWGIVPVGVTRFCEHPELQAVGGTKDPAVDAVLDLRPDLVVMCDQENRKEDYEVLVEKGLNVFAFSITDVAHVGAQMKSLRDRLGLVPNGTVEIEDVDMSPRGPIISVWVPIWKRPWMSIGGDTYASTLLSAVGFRNVYLDSEDRYPETPLDEVMLRMPDAVLAPSEPYPFAERHRETLEAVAPLTFLDGKDLFWWGARTPKAIQRLRQLHATFT
jgi:ABC-type Fe3+-hydroxamate transport system substrate-binding protein